MYIIHINTHTYIHLEITIKNNILKKRSKWMKKAIARGYLQIFFFIHTNNRFISGWWLGFTTKNLEKLFVAEHTISSYLPSSLSLSHVFKRQVHINILRIYVFYFISFYYVLLHWSLDILKVGSCSQTVNPCRRLSLFSSFMLGHLTAKITNFIVL